LYLYWLESGGEEVGDEVIRNETFEELVYYSRMFLNANTIEFYKTQMPLKETRCYEIWEEFLGRYKKLSLIEQNNMIVFSGMVLYLNNIRTCTDLDILYMKELRLVGEKYDIKKVDIEEDWRIRINKNMLRRGELIANPKYYQYYDGVKIAMMDVEMEIRGHRFNRPRAFVDMIMVNLKLNRKYKLPRLDMGGEELEVFYKTMQNAFKRRYNRIYSISEIKNLVSKYK
jgi:hypothetical protein